MTDFTSRIKVITAIAPAAATTDNTAYTTAILDCKDFNGATLVLQTGNETDADATFAVTISESDASDMSGSNAVASTDLIGTTTGASFTFADDNKAIKLGYVGTKRYIRATITPSNNTGNVFLSGSWILHNPRTLPQSAQNN